MNFERPTNQSESKESPLSSENPPEKGYIVPKEDPADIERRKNSEWIANCQALFMESLISEGYSEEEIWQIVETTEPIYVAMIDRLGTGYKEFVKIRETRVRNSCTGNLMKLLENTPFRILRGGQEGKHASTYNWGLGREDYKEYNQDGPEKFKGYSFLRSLTQKDKGIVRLRVSADNADKEIAKHLLPGECAPAGFTFGHAVMLVNVNGKIFVHHSGADYRDDRLEGDGSIPHGYKERKGIYVKKSIKGSFSKVNLVPVGFYMKHISRKIKIKRLELRFIPVTQLIQNQEILPPTMLAAN